MKNIQDVLDKIENDEMRELAIEMFKTIPAYWYTVPASSSGKYHPSYALGDGGLFRHTIAVCQFLEFFFETEVFNFNSIERDCLRIAAVMHDSRKSGTQADFEKNKYTKFDHPLQAAEVINSFRDKDWSNGVIDLMTEAVEAHMGKFNTSTRESTVLPVPKTKMQRILHLADYLASRKNLEVKFDG